MKLKQLLILRKDLNMSPGKAAAQAAHASIMAFLNLNRFIKEEVPEFNVEAIADSYVKNYDIINQYVADWLNDGQTKIVLQVPDERSLLKLEKKFEKNNIPNYLIIDEGRTEFNNIHTTTALGVGPYDADILTKIAGHLELYS